MAGFDGLLSYHSEQKGLCWICARLLGRLSSVAAKIIEKGNPLAPLCRGSDGNFRVKSVTALPWNGWQACSGIRILPNKSEA
jgi:hypothetical protein